MPKTVLAFDPEEQERFFSSSLSPGPVQKRLALAVVLGMLAVVLIILGPAAKLQPGRVEAFVPAYAMGMFVNDSITAILLFTGFSITRACANLVIASGYLFSALIQILWILAFPGVFAPSGLIGGLQSTSGFYFAWQSAFPAFVIGYALIKHADPSKRFWRGTVSSAIAVSAALTAALVSAVAFICIAGEPLLPRMMLDSTHFSPTWFYIVGAPLELLCIAALVVLWLRRRTVLDLWLLVVLCAYAVNAPLNYYPVAIRFGLGWYAARVTGFLASNIVLIVLLHEIMHLYSNLVRAVLAQRREREARLMTGDAVAATIAHEVRQPLTAMITNADAGLRFLDRAIPNSDKAKEAFKRILADGDRAGAVVESIRAIFKSDLRNRTLLDINELIREALTLVREDLRKRRVLVQAEQNHLLPEVRGDRLLLQQVLLNLITNAADAMTAKDEPRILCVKSEVYESDGVLVSIADNGTGIDPKDINRVFNPLFTTKSHGMGMGLAICRSIIEAHDGRLWVSANAPSGAVFHFTLR